MVAFVVPVVYVLHNETFYRSYLNRQFPFVPDAVGLAATAAFVGISAVDFALYDILENQVLDQRKSDKMAALTARSGRSHLAKADIPLHAAHIA